MMTWGFLVMVVLVAVACGNLGRAFCARGEWRCRRGMFRVCSAARAAASAAAATAFSDDVAVTWEAVMERIMCWRAAVKDSSSVVAGVPPFLRRARAAECSLRSAAASPARVSWVAVSQAHASWMTSRGVRSAGPDRMAVPGTGDRRLVLAECGL